ncbi:MAG: hypothetical protein LUH05_08865 [Candidatus Gastranaerophilales bacterium]|nr:hypothetical protein [Candidatus Gastranaerophilales bacterium]
MKRIFAGIFTIILIIQPAFCKNNEKLNVKSNSFMDLGRYVETLEVNDEYIEEENKNDNVEEDTFEEEAMSEVVRRYEENAVELNLTDISDSAINEINSERIFKLRVNETQYNIEQGIKNENMIWDTSKSFSQSILSNSRHLAPIPSIVNSSKIGSKISPSLSASMGQTSLYDANGPSVLFVRANESTYNTGSVISYKGNALNLSVGSFSSSYNHAASGGAVLSSNSINLPFKTGSIVVGGAYFANEAQDYDKSTGGGFIEYSYKRLKLNAQVGQSKYSNSTDYDTSLYLIPEFKISDSLYLKTRLIRNVTQDTMQDELALTYKPKNNKNNFEFEINASNQYTQNSTIKQRIKLSTSFRI